MRYLRVDFHIIIVITWGIHEIKDVSESRGFPFRPISYHSACACDPVIQKWFGVESRRLHEVTGMICAGRADERHGAILLRRGASDCQLSKNNFILELIRTHSLFVPTPPSLFVLEILRGHTPPSFLFVYICFPRCFHAHSFAGGSRELEHALPHS